MKLPEGISYGMIVVGMLCWIVAAFMVFINFEFFVGYNKWIFIISLFLTGQILFWIGSIKVGQKTWKKYPNDRFD